MYNLNVYNKNRSHYVNIKKWIIARRTKTTYQFEQAYGYYHHRLRKETQEKSYSS
jgi:hypothetical protein